MTRFYLVSVTVAGTGWQEFSTEHQALNQRLADVVMPDFHGVMDYEVSEPFGAWCRENFHCNPKDRRAEAKRLVDQFFNQGQTQR